MAEERSDDLFTERLREAARGADEELAAAILKAADENRYQRVAEIATEAVRGGTDRGNVLKACEAARLAINLRAPEGPNDPAEDLILDIMDRLGDWCAPESRI